MTDRKLAWQTERKKKQDAIRAKGDGCENISDQLVQDFYFSVHSCIYSTICNFYPWMEACLFLSCLHISQSLFVSQFQTERKSACRCCAPRPRLSCVMRNQQGMKYLMRWICHHLDISSILISHVCWAVASVKGLSFVFSIVRCFNCVVSVCAFCYSWRRNSKRCWTGTSSGILSHKGNKDKPLGISCYLVIKTSRLCFSKMYSDFSDQNCDMWLLYLQIYSFID